MKPAEKDAHAALVAAAVATSDLIDQGRCADAKGAEIAQQSITDHADAARALLLGEADLVLDGTRTLSFERVVWPSGRAVTVPRPTKEARSRRRRAA